MKFSVTPILSIFCLLYAIDAHADIYSCKDVTGQVITSDRPIPECADRAVKVRRNNGQFHRDIPAPPTAEERRLAKLAQEQKEKEERLDEARFKEERYLLAHYSSENDIELMRSRSLDMLNERIRLGKEQILTITQILLKLQTEQRNSVKKSAIEDAALQHRAQEMDLSIKKTMAINDAYEAEKVRVNARFDERLQHYREIPDSRKK